MNEKIASIAIEKSFATLNETERALVFSEMSQEAFEHLRIVLLAARQMDAGAEPPAHLRANLLEKMAAQPKPYALSRALYARVPAWLALAALVLGLGIAWLLKKERVQETIRTEIQLRTDTVWQEKTVWRERVVIRERIVYKEKPVAEPIAFLPEKTDSQAIELDFSQQAFTGPRVGTSLGDAPELMLFFTQGDK